MIFWSGTSTDVATPLESTSSVYIEYIDALDAKRRFLRNLD